MEHEQQLVAYAKEMGLHRETLTVADLISSHRTLRAFRMQSEAERRMQMQEARDFASKQATEAVMQYGWFSVERLRSMTLAELAELIDED